MSETENVFSFLYSNVHKTLTVINPKISTMRSLFSWSTKT